MWLGALGDEELVFDRERRGSVDSGGASRRKSDELLAGRGTVRRKLDSAPVPRLPSTTEASVTDFASIIIAGAQRRARLRPDFTAHPKALA